MPYISSIKMKNTIYDLRASAIGSVDVGSDTKPVYLKAGVPISCGSSLGVNITGNAATATSATTSGALSANNTSSMSDKTLQYFMASGTEMEITGVTQDCYILRMSKPGTTGYNSVQLAISSDDNSYIGYRVSLNDNSPAAPWNRIVDSSNFEKIIGTSYLKTSGGTMKGAIKFTSDSSGTYIEHDSGELTFRNQSGALICGTSSATLSSPGGEIKLESANMSIENSQKSGTITVTTQTNGYTLLNTDPILNYGHNLKGYNAATTQTVFRIAGFNGNTIFFGNGTASTDPPVRINAPTIYANGTTLASTSDANLKTNINSFDSRYDTFFDNLSPITFQYINGNQGRIHSGLLAQDVEEALTASGLSNSDFAVVTTMQIEGRETTTNEEGEEIDVEKSNINYLLDQGITEEKGLRYEEFIGLLIDQVQKLKKEVNDLKSQLK